MLDESTLIFHIAKKNAAYLTDKSLDALHAFLLGVDAGLAAYAQPALPRDISREDLREYFFRELMVTGEHASRLNAFNCMSPQAFCELMSHGEQDAFDLYIKTRKAAYLACPKSTLKDQSEAFKPPQRDFFEFIALVKKRPGMYVLKWDILAYENIARGFIYAEQQLLGMQSALDEELNAFKDWLDQRYPYGTYAPT